METVTVTEIIEMLEKKELEASKKLEQIFETGDKEKALLQEGKIAGISLSIMDIKMLIESK